MAAAKGHTPDWHAHIHYTHTSTHAHQHIHTYTIYHTTQSQIFDVGAFFFFFLDFIPCKKRKVD